MTKEEKQMIVSKYMKRLKRLHALTEEAAKEKNIKRAIRLIVHLSILNAEIKSVVSQASFKKGGFK